MEFARHDKRVCTQNKPDADLQPAHQLTNHVAVIGIDFSYNRSKEDTFSVNYAAETGNMKMTKKIICLLPCYMSDICHAVEVCFGGVQMLFIRVCYEWHTRGKCFL